MRLLRGLGLFIAIACLVWVGVLWHWQTTHRDMSVDDILLYLVALPITVFVLALLAGWAWRGASARAAAVPAAATAAAPAAAKSGAADTASAADEAARHATLQLLAAHLASPIGSSIDDVASAAELGEPRPALHDELRDAQGLPVIAAQVPDLSVDDTAQALEALALDLKRQHPDKPQATVDESLPRALTLLVEPLSEAIAGLAAWADRFQRPPREAGRPQAAVRHRVRVVPAWPAGLAEPQLALARAWLPQQLRMHGEGIVAAEAWAVHPGGAWSGPELWTEVDRLFATLLREGVDDPILVLACHSDITESTVRSLDDQGQLFSARTPKGVIPGEAAAALLLAGPRWPAAQADAPPAAHLHRAAMARRDKSVDAAGRVSADLPAELLRQAATVARLPATEIAGLADDADQHSARSPELFGAMLAQLPHLDASEDQRMLGHLTGRIGAVSTLLAVALAAQRATSSMKPWAALAVGDAHWRLALVARPTAPHAPETSAQATPETSAQATPEIAGTKTTT